MASTRAAFAVDDSITGAYGSLAIGIEENLKFWHMVRVLTVAPPQREFDRANDSEPACTSYAIYERLDFDTHKLWLAEYKLEFSRTHGVTKTLTWFDEEGAKQRYNSHWKPAMAKPGAVIHEGERHALHVHPDASFNIDKMKLQYTGFDFDTNTRRVGGPTMANLHHGVEPTAD